MPQRKTSRIPPTLWFVAGVVTALTLLWSQAAALGGWSGLLQTGEASNLKPVIEQEIPASISVPGPGHDGQISYAIALDLTGREVPALLDNAGYRYRRILFPMVASAFGTLDGSLLLAGMTVWAATGMGLASVGMAHLSREFGLSNWVQVAILANPGLWLAVRLLTPDALAFGLAMVGLAHAVRSRHLIAILLLAAAALTKDQYILSAFGMGLFLWVRNEHRTATWYWLFPSLALAAWSSFLSFRIGDGFTPRSNLALPFAGIIESATTWTEVSTRDMAFAVIALGLLALTMVALFIARSAFLNSIGWIWVVLALVSSSWVWDFGNNALRAFAFLMPVAALAFGETAARKRLREQATP